MTTPIPTFAATRADRLKKFLDLPHAMRVAHHLAEAARRASCGDDADEIAKEYAAAIREIDDAAARHLPSSGSPQQDRAEICARIDLRGIEDLIDALREAGGRNTRGRCRAERRMLFGALDWAHNALMCEIGHRPRESDAVVIWAGSANPSEWDIDAVAAGIEAFLDDGGFDDLTSHYLTAKRAIEFTSFGSPGANESLRKAAAALLQFTSCVEQMKAVGESMSKSEGAAS